MDQEEAKIRPISMIFLRADRLSALVQSQRIPIYFLNCRSNDNLSAISKLHPLSRFFRDFKKGFREQECRSIRQNLNREDTVAAAQVHGGAIRSRSALILV